MKVNVGSGSYRYTHTYRKDELYIRMRSQGSELAQSYTGVVTLGCTPLTAFACFQTV